MTKPRQAAEHERIEYQTLDGNWTPRVEGYCTYHHKYITERQARVHRCHAKHGGICGRYQDMEGVFVRKMKAEQYYDKVTDRLSKIETALSRIAKAAENISNNVDVMVGTYRDKSICKENICNSKDIDDCK